MLYPVGGFHKLDAWLETDPPERLAVLELLWLVRESPHDVPGARGVAYGTSPVYAVVVSGTTVALAWEVFDSPPFEPQYRRVDFLRVEPIM